MFDWLLRLFGGETRPVTGRPKHRPPIRRPSKARPKSAPPIPPYWWQRPTISCGPILEDVVGEASYSSALVTLMSSLTTAEAGGWLKREVVAELIPEPTNRYDRKAIRVDVGGATIGYVAREHTAEFHTLLEELEEADERATCRAQIVGKDGRYGVKLRVSDPLRRADAEEPLFSWATDTVAVEGEENHRDALDRLLGHRETVDVIAELCERGEGVPAVLIDGREVGRLSKKMAPRYEAHYVKAQAEGLQATCRAVISRGKRSPQVHLKLPRL